MKKKIKEKKSYVNLKAQIIKVPGPSINTENENDRNKSLITTQISSLNVEKYYGLDYRQTNYV